MTWEILLKKFEMSWLWKNIFYRMDWRKPTADSIKDFLKVEVEYTRQLLAAGKFSKFYGTQDEQMLQIQKWVMNNIKYEVDKARFNVNEKWQTVAETLNYMRGDCEDGAILIFCLARAHGISPGQINLNAGPVLVNNKEEGHCWVEYMPDMSFKATEMGEWYTMDWCYWPNALDFNNRIPKDLGKYVGSWFNVTDF